MTAQKHTRKPRSKKPPIEAEVVEVSKRGKRSARKEVRVIRPPVPPADVRVRAQAEIDRQTRIKKRPLTVREAKLIMGVAAGKTKRQAAKDAGYTGSDEVVSVTASQVLNKPNVKEAMQDALAQAGVTIQGIARVVADGMKAEKVFIIGDGESAMADVQPDHNIRLRAGGMAAKFLGLDDSEKQPGSQTIIFNQNNVVAQRFIKPIEQGGQ